MSGRRAMQERQSDLYGVMARAEGTAPAKAQCPSCSMDVVVLRTPDAVVMLDTEVMRVVRYGRRAAPEVILARRSHAELCDSYQRERRRARLAVEKKEWMRAQRSSPARGRGGRKSAP